MMRERQVWACTSWYVYCMCVVHWRDLSVQTHTQTHTHTNKSLDETPLTQSRDLIPSLSYLWIEQVPRCTIRRKKRGGGHKPSEEEHAPFEVAFLLGTSFGITRVVKQIIKCNGLGGLWSFISDGKNKVLDDLGDSGAGFDGNSHACWYCLLVLTDRCYHLSWDKELLTQLYWDMK